ATCLSVSQEGTITAKAPGTTTISTSIELEEIPLTHTTRTISVVAPTPSTTPEQPETPTPTPPIAQPITPRYPPNLATPVQASAPLYSRGAAQPRVSNFTISVTVPTAPIITFDAAGKPKPNDKASTVNIESTIEEPIRVASIKCTEQPDAKQLLTNLDTVDPGKVDPAIPGSPERRDNTKVTVKSDKDFTSEPLSLNLGTSTAGYTWLAPENSSLFRIDAGLPAPGKPAELPITFGLTIPNNATFSYLSKPANFAQVEFTYGLLAPIATSLTLSSTTPKVGDTLTATPTGTVLDPNPTYAWYVLDKQNDPLESATPIPGATQSTLTLPKTYEGKYICCVAFNGDLKAKTWINRPVYSDVTAPVAAGAPPIRANLNDYPWDELSKIADDLSAHAKDYPDTPGKGSIYYDTFHKFLTDDQAAAAVAADAAATRNKPEYHKLTTLTDRSDPAHPKESILEVRIVGINHDVKSDGTGTAGLTFLAVHSLHDAYRMNSSNTNSGGWEKSELRKRMQPFDATDNNVKDISGTIWDTLPADLRADGVIKKVNKQTSNKGGEGTVGKDATPTKDKLWIPSYGELANKPDAANWLTSYPWLAGEGSQYTFLKNKVPTPAPDSKYTILAGMDKTQGGGSPVGYTGTCWWERSCGPNDGTSFLLCGTSGDPTSGSSASYRYGVVLGFSL
ncbi:MAG: hypothetical protein RR204_05950, partial [Raoultibacter sp.]